MIVCLTPECRGNFVNPEKYYPETFGKIEILRTYPYLLPCLLSAALTMCSIIVGAVFLKEVCELDFVHIYGTDLSLVVSRYLRKFGWTRHCRRRYLPLETKNLRLLKPNYLSVQSSTLLRSSQSSGTTSFFPSQRHHLTWCSFFWHTRRYPLVGLRDR